MCILSSLILAIARNHVTRSQGNLELLVVGGNVGYRAVGLQLHSSSISRLQQALNDRLSVVARWKQAAIGFSLELDAVGSKPGDRVAGLEASKGTPQYPTPPRIGLTEENGIKTGVGDITTPTPGNTHLSEGLRSCFQDQNVHMGMGLCCRDRPKDTGCPSANNCDPHWVERQPTVPPTGDWLQN